MLALIRRAVTGSRYGQTIVHLPCVSVHSSERTATMSLAFINYLSSMQGMR